MSVPSSLAGLWDRFCASDDALKAFGVWLARRGDLGTPEPSANPETTPHDELSYTVYEASCPKHGELRGAFQHRTESVLCPLCGAGLVARPLGKAKEGAPWEWLDKRTGAAGGRKGGVIRRGPPTNARTCEVPGCEKKHLAKGLCRVHYEDRRRHGKAD